MITKAEIVVEKFNEGITTRWSNTEGTEPETKCLAPEGDEAACIGNELWRDICSIDSEKVLVKIEYEAIK